MSVAKRRIQLQGIAPQSVHEVSTGVSTKVSMGVSTGVSITHPSRRLTSAQLAALPGNGKTRDISDPSVQGLILRIGPNGTKNWLFRYKWKGNATRISLGEFPKVGLADARQKANEHREQISQGIDPRNASRPGALTRHIPSNRPKRPIAKHFIAAPMPQEPSPEPTNAGTSRSIDPPPLGDRNSVQFLAYEYIELYVRPHREYPEEPIRIIKKDILPFWGTRDARTITNREVIERLDEIVARGARVMANRTAKVLKQMFKFGIHRAIVEQSPVQLLFRPGGREKPRDRALSDQELACLIQGLDAVCASPQKAAIIMLLLLTLQRRSSLALAQWSEIDFDKKLWNIPAQHDKMRRAHTVPLTELAIEQFKILKKFSADSLFVLPTQQGTMPASPQLISRIITVRQKKFEAIGITLFTTHDLRRTGRTQLAKLGVSAEVAERVLNHCPERIEGTYNIYDYLLEKRESLARWENRMIEFKQMDTGLPVAETVMAELMRETIKKQSHSALERRLAKATSNSMPD